MERAGVPRSIAMKLTGDKTESIYRRYAIVSGADLQEATRKWMVTPAGTPATATGHTTPPDLDPCPASAHNRCIGAWRSQVAHLPWEMAGPLSRGV
jgi:hypothetical protein